MLWYLLLLLMNLMLPIHDASTIRWENQPPIEHTIAGLPPLATWWRHPSALKVQVLALRGSKLAQWKLGHQEEYSWKSLEYYSALNILRIELPSMHFTSYIWHDMLYVVNCKYVCFPLFWKVVIHFCFVIFNLRVLMSMSTFVKILPANRQMANISEGEYSK